MLGASSLDWYCYSGTSWLIGEGHGFDGMPEVSIRNAYEAVHSLCYFDVSNTISSFKVNIPKIYLQRDIS